MTAIEVSNLRKTFPNGHTALADVSFRIPEGQFVCIVGRSGAGKSTLMRCLNASVPITSGEAVVGGQAVSALNSSSRRVHQRRVGFIYQEFNLVGRLSSLQNVLSGRLGFIPTWRAICMYFTRSEREIALEALARVNMLHKAPQRCDSLSGGEKQRVAIARALAQQPELLLADEPVANLDPELAEGVLKDLRAAAKDAGLTTLLNIHNIGQARRYADRIIGIAQGQVVFDGKPEEFDAQAENRVYRFDQEMESDIDLRRELDPHVVHDLDKAMKRAMKTTAEVEMDPARTGDRRSS
ncbi:MAG: phosphonate ABC transporter ATP-binding protein [Dehalococcoidia bacterium]|uniref:phosphonate ABC transporter ATP-binding protein n=1 Tax=Candidatus Amarobacter glycogenicus TaxID=3140699 RepID=UPI001D98F9C7|nr:phosphonate ABC transporter ATP-binding protein [Dehalococcoidia bacterium]MBK7327884.1 phosphonate ABC transporter ATP-binding protein [Dehalococcoidia bacterium]MBK7726786.1 phosphonate ABC transporter ATP-binding protein [Dehalococcoidia bacterium]MBK9612397.1 phosphonate ABC transporter ATP-binding protein [Dehalococcoidia bacterium]